MAEQSSLGIEGLGFGNVPNSSTSGFSGFGDTVGSAISGVGDTVGSALSSSFSTPFGDVSVGDVALSLGLSAFTGIPGLGLAANAIGSAFGPSTGTAFGIGEQTGSGVSQGQQSAYGSTTGGPTDLGINAYGQAVDPNAEAVTGIDADAQAAAEAQAEVAALATADAIGFGLADDYADDIGDDGGASGSAPGAEMGGSEFRDGGIMQLGGYSVDQQPGAETSNFYLRTPEQGIDFGSFGGDKNLLNLTGKYGRSISEVTPEALGIPQEAIDYFRLENQKQKSTSYNIGIRSMFPDGVVPDFIDRVLRPKSVNASFGQSESTFQNVQGDTFTNSDRRRGIGGQGQVLRAMFENNAPTVGVQYFEPNKYDKQISGNVNIPVREGNLDLSAKKYINEGRDNSESFKAGLNYPVGPGTASIEAERTPDGENRGMVRYRIPI